MILFESEFVLRSLGRCEAAHQRVSQCLGRVGDRVRLTRGILGAVLVEEKCGHTAYQLAASAADDQSGEPVLSVFQVLAHKSPAGNTSVVSRTHRRHTGGLLHYLKAAFARVLPTVPKVGRGNGKFNVLTSAKLRNTNSRFAERQIRRAEFVGDVNSAVRIGDADIRGEHIEAVVEGNDRVSCAWDGVFCADVPRFVEFGEELPFENVPFTVKPSLTKSRRQSFEPAHIVGIGAGENSVVEDGRGDEGVIVGILAAAVFAVDEEPLYPSVTDSAGVAGEIHTPRAVPSASQTSLEDGKLIFAQLRCFVEGYYVVFLPLIAKGVALGGGVAEGNGASVFKAECAVALAVGEDLTVLCEQRIQMVRAQLGESSAHKQAAKSGVSQAHKHQLSPKSPGFTASARASVGDELTPTSEKFALTVVWNTADAERTLGRTIRRPRKRHDRRSGGAVPYR